MSILEINNMSSGYGRSTILRNISFAIEPGETLFVTGPNGAGKSTLLKTLAGVIKPNSGDIRFNDVPIEGKAPEEIAKLGFSMVPEGRDCFAGLTVEENLKVGAGLNWGNWSEALSGIYADFPILAERRNLMAGLLSGGQQQMLVIARALMTGSKFIAIDEPSLGLAPNIVDQVYDILLNLRVQENLSLLIVEQSSVRASVMGGKLLVLRNGEIALSGDAQELAVGDALRDAYFGYEKAD